jgi:transposase InsO family protein
MEMIQGHGAGIDLEKIENFECRDCPVGRLTRRPCKETEVVSGLPGEHIGADLCGPIQVASLGGARYFLFIKDRVTCYRQAYFLETKEGHTVALRMREYVQMSRTRTNRRVKTLRTDNETEFINQEMGALLNEMGIKHERTIPYSPEQNGSVERDNRTIVEMARTMIHAGKLPMTLWAELVNTAVYIHNRVPNRREKKSPYELHDGLVIGKEEKDDDKILDNIRKEFEITSSMARQYIGIEIDR